MECSRAMLYLLIATVNILILTGLLATAASLFNTSSPVSYATSSAPDEASAIHALGTFGGLAIGARALALVSAVGVVAVRAVCVEPVSAVDVVGLGIVFGTAWLVYTVSG